MNKVTKPLLVLIALIFGAVIFSSAPSYAYQQDLTGLLNEHIKPASKDGISYAGVDYEAWKTDPRRAIVLNDVLSTKLLDLKSKDQKMAFWINAYNVLTIDLILKEGEQKSIKNLGGALTSPWKKHNWTIDGNAYTLHQIEHKILRPMGDARIHFAINCASISCPDLRRESYSASNLNQQLSEQTKLTLKNTKKGLRIEENTIYVSKIFSWFKEDFSDGDIKKWLAQYTDTDASQNLKFMPYDWSLNKQ